MTSVPKKSSRCVICHKWFVPFRKDKKTCSSSCAKKRQLELKKDRNKKLEVKVCEICGDPFFPKTSNAKYCKKKSCKNKGKLNRKKAIRKERIVKNNEYTGRRCQYILDEWETTERVCDKPVKKGNYFFCEEHSEIVESEHQATGY